LTATEIQSAIDRTEQKLRQPSGKQLLIQPMLLPCWPAQSTCT
jgi:hypothetical protein